MIGTILIAVPLVVVAFVAVTRAAAGLNELTDQQLAARAAEIAHTIDRVYAEERKIAFGMANNPAVVAAAATRAELKSAGTPGTGKAAAAARRPRSGSRAFDKQTLYYVHSCDIMRPSSIIRRGNRIC